MNRDQSGSIPPQPPSGALYGPARDGASHDDEDFRPADLARLAPDDPSGPRVGADFVARATARVLADQARIRAEAEAVESIVLPRAWLDALPAPAPSADFVARAMRAVATSESAAGEEDARLRGLLARYEAPRISGDFVERTLDALRESAPAPSLRLVPVSGRAVPRWRRPLVAAAAVLVIALGLAFAFSGGGDAPVPERVSGPELASALNFSPSAATTAFARLSAANARGTDEDDLELVPLDGLLLLAQGAVVRGE